MLLTLVARIFRHPASLRNTFAVASYATVPLSLSAILILPVEILTFGRYLFTKAPSAYALKPVSFIALSTLDGLFAAWSLVLIVIGIRALLDVGWGRAAAVAAVSLGIVAAGLAYVGGQIVAAYAPG
jgi:hypothetical protein